MTGISSHCLGYHKPDCKIPQYQGYILRDPSPIPYYIVAHARTSTHAHAPGASAPFTPAAAAASTSTRTRTHRSNGTHARTSARHTAAHNKAGQEASLYHRPPGITTPRYRIEGRGYGAEVRSYGVPNALHRFTLKKHENA